MPKAPLSKRHAPSAAGEIASRPFRCWSSLRPSSVALAGCNGSGLSRFPGTGA